MGYGVHLFNCRCKSLAFVVYNITYINTTKAQQNVQLTSGETSERNCLRLLKSYCLLTWRLFSWGKSLFHRALPVFTVLFLQWLYFMPLACYDIGLALEQPNNRVHGSSGLLRPTSSRRCSGQPDLKVETPGSAMASVRTLYSSIFLTNDFESGFAISRISTRRGILQMTTFASVVIQRRGWLLAKLAQRYCWAVFFSA